MTSRIELQLAIVIKIFSYHSHLASYINWEMNNYLFKVLCSMQGSILKVATICNCQLQRNYNAFKYYCIRMKYTRGGGWHFIFCQIGCPCLHSWGVYIKPWRPEEWLCEYELKNMASVWLCMVFCQASPPPARMNEAI